MTSAWMAGSFTGTGEPGEDQTSKENKNLSYGGIIFWTLGPHPRGIKSVVCR